MSRAEVGKPWVIHRFEVSRLKFLKKFPPNGSLSQSSEVWKPMNILLFVIYSWPSLPEIDQLPRFKCVQENDLLAYLCEYLAIVVLICVTSANNLPLWRLELALSFWKQLNISSGTHRWCYVFKYGSKLPAFLWIKKKKINEHFTWCLLQ